MSRDSGSDLVRRSRALLLSREKRSRVLRLSRRGWAFLLYACDAASTESPAGFARLTKLRRAMAQSGIDFEAPAIGRLLDGVDQYLDSLIEESIRA